MKENMNNNTKEEKTAEIPTVMNENEKRIKKRRKKAAAG